MPRCAGAAWPTACAWPPSWSAAVIVGGLIGVRPGLVARHQALAVPAVLRVGVRGRRPQCGEGLRADAEGDHGQDRRQHRPQGAGRRGLTGDCTWQHRMWGPRAAECPIPSISSRSTPILPIKLFGWDVSFTNSSLFMLVAVLLIAGFFMLSMRAALAGADAAAVDGRDQPRVRGRHAARQRRAAGHEVLPLRVHALHLHLRRATCWA